MGWACPCKRREVTVSANNGLQCVHGLVHHLRMQFFTLGSSRVHVGASCEGWRVLPRCLLLLAGWFMVIPGAFWMLWGTSWCLLQYGVWGRGPPKGLVYNLLMQFFTLGSSKIEVSEH